MRRGAGVGRGNDQGRGRSQRRSRRSTADVAVQTDQIITKPGYKLDFLKPRLRAKLRYAQTFTLSTGAAGVVGTSQLMRLNSLYDPDMTGTGHQPYLFDQVAALYAKYRVDAVKVELTWSTIGSAAEVGTCVQFSSSGGAGDIAGSSLDAITERANVYTSTLSSTGNQRTVKLLFKKKLHKIEGVTKSKYRDEDNYGADVTTNPALPIYMYLGVGSYSGQASEASTVQCVITFDTLFYERKLQSQS